MLSMATTYFTLENNMKRYKVIYTETRTLVDYIEAESKEEAYDKFHNENDYQSSDWVYYDEETKIEEKEQS
jgi:hypothetical protein